MIVHTYNFQISGRGCQILPWSWHSRSFLTGISNGSPSRRETNSENHVWEGQNGASRRRRTPYVFTRHNTAGMSLTGGNHTGLPDQTPQAGLPSKAAPHPETEASVIWWWQTTPILTPLRRKLGSCHTKRARRQAPDTLSRRRDGQEGRIPMDFFHQRNGLVWSSPKGTGEASAKRPKSLQHRPTDMRRPSLKRAVHDWMLSTRAGPRWACIEVESRQTSKNVVCWAGVSTIFWPFSRRPSSRRWRESLWRITCSLELAKMSQSSR